MNYIYLHGYASGAKSTKALYFKNLLKKHNILVHLPDLNGTNFDDMTVTSQIEIVEDIIHKCKGPIIIVGSSMGGFIAALLAERHNRIKKLVLLAPAFEFIPMQKKILGNELIKEWGEKGFREVDHHYYGKKRKLKFSFYEDAIKYENFQLNRDLPVLIFHGINDETVPFNVSVNYLKMHPLAKLILLNSDHSLASELKFLGGMTRDFLNLNG